MDNAVEIQRRYKSMSLKQKAALFAELIQQPGWELLKLAFRPEMKTQVSDQNSREAFYYQAVRAQVIQEIFATPHQVIQQVDKDYFYRRALAYAAGTLSHPEFAEALEEPDAETMGGAPCRLPTPPKNKTRKEE